MSRTGMDPAFFSSLPTPAERETLPALRLVALEQFGRRSVQHIALSRVLDAILSRVEANQRQAPPPRRPAA